MEKEPPTNHPLQPPIIMLVTGSLCVRHAYKIREKSNRKPLSVLTNLNRWNSFPCQKLPFLYMPSRIPCPGFVSAHGPILLPLSKAHRKLLLVQKVSPNCDWCPSEYLPQATSVFQTCDLQEPWRCAVSIYLFWQPCLQNSDSGECRCYLGMQVGLILNN